MSALFGGGFLLLFLGFFALVIVLIVVGVIQNKKRREGLAAFAASRGWVYRESDPGLVTRFSGNPFGTGDSRRATNCLYGAPADRQMVAFDYQYTTTSGSGDDRRTTPEDRIAASRRFYNGNVRAYNTRVRTFPSNVVAAMFGFDAREFFELRDQAAALPPAV